MDNKELIRVFISQPMGYREENDILKERASIENKLREYIDPNLVELKVIDSYLDDDDPRTFISATARAIWCLGYSIECLAGADVAVFAKGYEGARGCIIERQVCESYGIPYLYEGNMDDTLKRYSKKGDLLEYCRTNAPRRW